MSFPTGDEQDLPSISASLHTGAMAQDMVVALTHALHDRELSTRDRDVLHVAVELLRTLADPPLAPHRQTTRQLADTSSTLAAVRATGHDQANPDTLVGLATTLDALLHDQARPEHDQIVALRSLFLVLGRINEQSRTLGDSRESLETWISLSTTSPSS